MRIKTKNDVAPVLVILLTSLLISYLLWVGIHMHFDMFDSFDIFLNSRTIAGRTDGWYVPGRSFIVPTLFSPIFKIESLLGYTDGIFALIGCHITSVAIFGILGWACFLLFKEFLPKNWAALGALLVVSNPLIIHFAPTSRDDIPGTLFTTLAFYFYVKCRESAKLSKFLPSAFFTFLAMGTRFNTAPLIPIVYAGFEIIERRLSFKNFFQKLSTLVVLPSVFWILLPSVIYILIGRTDFLNAPAAFLNDLLRETRKALGSEMSYLEYPSENLVFLSKSFSPGIFVFSIYGTCLSLKRNSGVLFHLLWLGVFLTFHSFILGHKEARYLFVLFPAFAFLAIAGLNDLFNRIPSKFSILKIALIFVTLATPTWNALAECLKFKDPFYTNTLIQDSSTYALSLAGDRDILWAGPFYAIHPKDFVFDNEDEVTYLYHYFIHTVRYYTGKTMHVLQRGPQMFVGEDPTLGVFPHPAVAAKVNNGDVLIANLETDHYVTKSVPTNLKPLYVERAKIEKFSKSSTQGQNFFQSARSPRSAIKESLLGQNYILEGSAIENGIYEVIAEFKGGKGGLGFVTVKEGIFKLTLSRQNLPPDAHALGLSLLSFEAVRSFSTAQN